MEGRAMNEKRQLCECGCGQFANLRRKHRGKPMRFLSGHNSRREHNPNWRGGRGTSWHGYILINTGHGYIFEHVLIFEEHYRCCLLTWGIVHHIDGNRQNNLIGNLQGMTRAQHLKHHNPYQYTYYVRRKSTSESQTKIKATS